jgi:galactose mutarotase-like enzyme
MLTLKNNHLKVVVRPEIGGRIDDIVDVVSEKNWMWHPSYYEPEKIRERSLGQTETFDEIWSGGWDEMFPSDPPEQLGHWRLPDHGDLWRRPWEVTYQDPLSVTMGFQCTSVNVEVKKTITLMHDASVFDVRYQLRSNEKDSLPFLFKLHPAISIEAGDEFLMPDCEIEPVNLASSKILGLARKSKFPHGYDAEGDPVSIAKARGYDGETREFVFASALAEGWCGINNRRTGRTFKISFDRRQLPFVWIFQSYGGFRSHYVAILEPATTIPYTLHKAIEQKTCAILEPGETKTYDVRVSIS